MLFQYISGVPWAVRGPPRCFRRLAFASVGPPRAFHSQGRSRGGPQGAPGGPPQGAPQARTGGPRRSKEVRTEARGPPPASNRGKPPGGAPKGGLWGAPGGPQASYARFPRPDLDEAALKEEQQKAQGAPHWLLVESEVTGPGGPRWRPGAPRGLDAPRQEEGDRGPPGAPSSVPSFFSEGRSDWRLGITEEFDADWAWLSGGPWASDPGGPLGAPSGGAPEGATLERLEDKRLKVYVQGLDIPKPIALLNKQQLLQTLQQPHRALGLKAEPQQKQNTFSGGPSGGPPSGPQSTSLGLETDRGSASASPLMETLCPEAYEALVERAKNILRSFQRQQLLQLLLLLQQHTRALQQQHHCSLQEARSLSLQANAAAAAAAAAGEHQQEHHQLLVEEAARAAAAAAAAERGLRALQQQQLFELIFDAALPHLPHMPLEELGTLATAFAVCVPTKGLGVLQVVALHAFDRCCSALWGPPATAAAEEGAPQKGGALTLRVLQVLQPFALSLQRQGALRAPLHHTRGPPVGPPFAATDLHGPLAAAGGGPPETGGGLGFASRRLLEVITKDLEAPELSSLPRGALLQLLLCCCSVGSGASAAPLAAAQQCLDLLFRGPLGGSLSPPEGGPHSAAEGGPLAAAEGGPQGPKFTLEEALWVLVSCAYREARGGPPAWLLPVLHEVWGPSSAAEGLLLLQGPQELRGPPVYAEETAAGALCAVRCSPPLGAPGGPQAALLSSHQLQYLLQQLDASLPPLKGGPEAPAEALLLQQPHLLPAAASSTDGGAHLSVRFSAWMMHLNCYRDGGPQGATNPPKPFDYLEDPEGPQREVQTATVPTAGALAAAEALAWALSRLLQQQRQQQQQQQQQQEQLPTLQESIKRAHRLLLSVVHQVRAAAAAPLLSASALIQGAHALADAAEHLMGAPVGGPSRGPPVAAVQQFEAQSAFMGLEAAAGHLLLAACSALQRGPHPGVSLEGLLVAVCCCIYRFAGGRAGGVGPHRDPQQNEGALSSAWEAAADKGAAAAPAAAAAAAAFATSAARCLREFRLLLGGPPSSSLSSVESLSLRTQAKWLGALGALLQCEASWGCGQSEQQQETQEGGALNPSAAQKKTVSSCALEVHEEAASAALYVAAAWAPLLNSTKNKRQPAGKGGPPELLAALQGLLRCVKPLTGQPRAHADAAAAATETATTTAATAATQGLNAALDQLLRASPYGSEQEVAAAAELAQQLLQLQQQLQRQQQLQQLPKEGGPQGALYMAITGISTGKLQQLQGLSSSSSHLGGLQQKQRQTSFVAIEPAAT
ncbi:hypothetical protein, conserved [Eimeria acervulina]|uniref:Uncharacterized protein n=1 Tax=Eimeria acervulina TaxID=5801 RepID=U6GE04_EIMAC|nr:hypothetical protein, conserved [Eimeria acervulina]CDI78390.1 hypothetical protein, conserved [Eimeria acervulina]